jgi:hypothetical protein
MPGSNRQSVSSEAASLIREANAVPGKAHFREANLVSPPHKTAGAVGPGQQQQTFNSDPAAKPEVLPPNLISATASGDSTLALRKMSFDPKY